MQRSEWVRQAVDSTTLTERQAEAFYRRQAGEGRRDAAAAMDTSASNVDNAEREARQKVIDANNLLALAGAIGAEPDETAPIGTCAECDEPTTQLHPDPATDAPLEERRMLCEACAPGDAEGA